MKTLPRLGVSLSLFLYSLGVQAQLVIDDKLNGASSSYPWQSIGGACLTAGNGRGSIPGCASQRDPVGQGALRLTPANTDSTGGVISRFSLPSSQGLQVTFTSVTYGGNRFGGTGADGMSFFLIDANRMATVNSSTRLGSFGGSLGYANSNRPHGAAGIVGGYLGIGIDEYGNFSNPDDSGTGGPGFAPNAIALRGSAQTGYRYITGSTVQGSIASSTATQRAQAEPITFNLNITPAGLLNMSYSRNGGLPNTVLRDHPINTANGRLPSDFRFGFAASTGTGTNIHEITCFRAAGNTVSASSAGSNALQSAQVQLGTQLYLANYHTDNWWGQLTAQDILLDPVTKKLSIARVANWDASCTLTGGACAATGRRVDAQRPDDRTMLTFGGGVGNPFRWDALYAHQQVALDPAAAAAQAPTSARVDYLRGDRRSEGNPLRKRTGVLGDIIHSSPTLVGPPQQAYDDAWRDALYPAQSAPEGNSYQDFAKAMATRTNVVYVGANDGMLHGFRAGAYTAKGDYDSRAPNDGRELLAYVPAASLMALHSGTPQLDYSSPQYAHNAFVDATPGVGDLFYAGKWHTWLVSGMGGGGNPGGVLGDNNAVGQGTLFALDVTDPAQFSEDNSDSLVIDEWTSADLSCIGDPPRARCREHLGSTFGTPVIRRMHDGNWAVIFGNGFNSRSGSAGVFVVTVDSQTGARRARYLETGTGTVLSRNGIAYVTPVDLDGDDIADYLYAGDLHGNVWRFDVTSADPAQWRARKAPLFRASNLPITTRLAVAVVSSDAGKRLMVNFGTGQMHPQTLGSPAWADPQAHALFGVWDWDMDAWNRLGTQQLLSLTEAASRIVLPNDLQAQTLTTNASYVNGAIHGVRTISSHAVCWRGSSRCAASNHQFGWRVTLPGAQEQVIDNPVIQHGLFQVSTTIPAASQRLSCSPTPPATGFTLAITPDQGMAPVHSYFADAVNHAPHLGHVAGIGLNAVGTPMHLSVAGSTYLFTQTSSGTPTLTQVTPPTGGVKRLTWRHMR